MDTIITALADYSALGLFAGFLAWQFVHQQRQIQAMQADFQRQVGEMQEKAEATTDKVRDRYDKIIVSKDELYARLTGKLESDIEYIRGAVDKLGSGE
jgi:peptidoglycan hydrolase CwlO-like protein